jgi:sulfur-oxidizing protein SoxB
MNLAKREFLQVLGAGMVAGMQLGQHSKANASAMADQLYELPAFGQVSLLHMTDCHAQLLPIHLREPNVNIGTGSFQGKYPHLVGEQLLKYAQIPAGSVNAHAFTHLDFQHAAIQYGKVGGFAHLATLVKRLKASRPGALLLDGGDSWQGSGTALWTQGQDMVEACKLLGVDIMTGHWEFTLGMDRVQEIVQNHLKGKIDFIAQNIKTNDFGDSVFKPFVMREINGIPCAIIGQAYPYTPIANPRYFVADWQFGIQEASLQNLVEEVRALGAELVVLLSHNGSDIDLKLASRISGIDAILGGHTHDPMPMPAIVSNPGGQTIVTNAGSNGKFLGVIDFEIKSKKVTDFRYKLLPVFSEVLAADLPMAALINKLRRPYSLQLQQRLAITEGLLYRRGNFGGTGDQLIINALMQTQDAEIVFSPGFRWGTTLLPGQAITREWLMDMTATTYSYATVNRLTGLEIKNILEDVCDNLFNPDPYLQQGGDMVRVGGLQYTCQPNEGIGRRISNLWLHGKPLDANKTYKVAGWAPVAEEAKNKKLKPVWELIEQWLKSQNGRIKEPLVNTPQLTGVLPNAGYEPA